MNLFTIDVIVCFSGIKEKEGNRNPLVYFLLWPLKQVFQRSSKQLDRSVGYLHSLAEVLNSIDEGLKLTTPD